MKKLFFLAAAMIAAVSMNAETLTFNADTVTAVGHKSTGAWSDGYTWSMTNIDVTLVDSLKKMTVDANNALFGDANGWVKLESRLRPNGATYEKKDGDGNPKGIFNNYIEVTVYTAGKLTIAPRSSNKDAADRNLVVRQADGAAFPGGTVLLDQIVKDADAIKVPTPTTDDPNKTTACYPVYSVDVQPGIVTIAYPVNAINIYAIAFGDIETALGEAEAEGAKAVKKMIDGQIVIEKGGKLYNALGAEL